MDKENFKFYRIVKNQLNEYMIEVAETELSTYKRLMNTVSTTKKGSILKLKKWLKERENERLMNHWINLSQSEKIDDLDLEDLESEQ